MILITRASMGVSTSTLVSLLMHIVGFSEGFVLVCEHEWRASAHTYLDFYR